MEGKKPLKNVLILFQKQDYLLEMTLRFCILKGKYIFPKELMKWLMKLFSDHLARYWQFFNMQICAHIIGSKLFLFIYFLNFLSYNWLREVRSTWLICRGKKFSHHLWGIKLFLKYTDQKNIICKDWVFNYAMKK